MALLDHQVPQGSTDYFVAMEDVNVLKNLSNMGEHLKSLKVKLLEAEARFEDAKKEYDYYASSILPMAMFNAGLDSITLSSGGTLAVDRKFRCTPNKNAADRAIQAHWLRQHGLDELISVEATVKDIDKLEATGISYVEVNDINTNKLKAHLIDLLGIKGGEVKIKLEDIPDCFHFQEVTECSISL